jgi:hypothetical protein
MDSNSDNKTFQSNIIKWLDYDNKIKKLNEELKGVREQRILVEDDITGFITVKKIMDKSIQIPSYNSNIRYSETHTLENLSLRYIKECLDECMEDKDTVNALLSYIKDKRVRKTKIGIKRDMMNN